MKHPKTSVFGIALLVVFFSISLNAQQNKAVLYMQKINKVLNAIMVDTWDYTSEVAHGKNARLAEAKRKDLVRTSRFAIDRVSHMEPFEGNTQYRDSVISYLRINYIVLNEDYEKIMNMEEIAEQSYDKMEAYLLAQELADQKLDSASDRMEEQERIFAQANNINLIDTKDKLAKKLEKAGDVMKHYHAAYLVFFKPYKQEAYLLDGISRKDINAMEQNKNALAAVSAEGLEKLKTMSSYKSDKSLINAGKNALEFFQMEATTKIGNIVDFYMQEEKFEKIKTSLESKPQSERSSEEIKQYNDAVRDFNNRLNSYNKQNTALYNSRNGVLNDWDNSVRSFLDRHVPRYK